MSTQMNWQDRQHLVLWSWATTLWPCCLVRWVSFGWEVIFPGGWKSGRCRKADVWTGCNFSYWLSGSLTDTNKMFWVSNLLRHPPGAGRKLNWIYGPSQICPIDFSRHLRCKYLSEAQKRGLNFLHGHNHLSWSPAAVAASVFGFLSKSCMTDAGWRDGRRPKIGRPLMGFWDLNSAAPSCLLFLSWNGYVLQWKHRLIFCLLLCTFTMEFILKW